jgi:hypothetical protein
MRARLRTAPKAARGSGKCRCANTSQMRHAQTSENSKHATTNRVTNNPNVMLHRAIEIANKFAGCFIAPPIRLGTLTGQYSSRECNSLLCPGLSQLPVLHRILHE